MAMESLHNLSPSRNVTLKGRIVNWDEGEVDHGRYGRISRGRVVAVLESPFLLVEIIGRAGEVVPSCMFILSMVEVRAIHVFKTEEDEERWLASHLSKIDQTIEGRPDPPQIEEQPE